MTDDLPPGIVGECRWCGGLLIIDEENRRTYHGSPACPGYLEACRADGARQVEAPFCYVCRRSDRELRPYGKRRKPICFSCIQSSPEREREARKWVRRDIRRAGGVPTIVEGVGIISAEEAARRGLDIEILNTETGQILPRGAKA